uniref:NadR/Ttd14 AAA domain-containing protein n=1 Tax=Solibacter usitatus (strain Ellin6076) TaxID=234267 RepID=Q01N80_SOLUE
MEPVILNPNLFVVSGGPGSGKTTLLRELAKSGLTHAPEVAREIIQEQVHSGGTALPWAEQQADRQAYTHLMLQRSIDSFLAHTPALRPTFSDRGIPDTLCYARLIGLSDTRIIEHACARYRYAPLVFLAPPWKEIYATDAERKQDFTEAEQTYLLMIDVYHACGYDAVELPRITPSARAHFVLQQLGLGHVTSA